MGGEQSVKEVVPYRIRATVVQQVTQALFVQHASKDMFEKAPRMHAWIARNIRQPGC